VLVLDAQAQGLHGFHDVCLYTVIAEMQAQGSGQLTPSSATTPRPEGRGGPRIG
jgi:hypothetical protein